MGSGNPILSGQIWCCSLPSEFCWPTPGPGGLAHEVNSDFGVGLIALGIGSSSLNGERISGLVGNSSVYSESANAIEVAPKTPSGEFKPLRARAGSSTRRPAPRPNAAAPAALNRRTLRRETRPDCAGASDIFLTLLRGGITGAADGGHAAAQAWRDEGIRSCARASLRSEKPRSIASLSS